MLKHKRLLLNFQVLEKCLKSLKCTLKYLMHSMCKIALLKKNAKAQEMDT